MDAALKSWESKSVFLNYVTQGGAYIMINNHVEAPRGYYSCTVGGGTRTIRVGLIVNQRQQPVMLPLPSSGCALFGYDQSISVVDYESVSVGKTINLEGIFFEFIIDREKARILALHELGVVALSEYGDELWRYLADDIIESWSLADDHLVLKIMDAETPFVLNLKSNMNGVGLDFLNERGRA